MAQDGMLSRCFSLESLPECVCDQYKLSITAYEDYHRLS